MFYVNELETRLRLHNSNYSVHAPPYSSVVENNIVFFYSTRLWCLFKNVRSLRTLPVFVCPRLQPPPDRHKKNPFGAPIVFLNRCVDLRSRKPTVHAYDIILRNKNINNKTYSIRFSITCATFYFFLLLSLSSSRMDIAILILSL